VVRNNRATDTATDLPVARSSDFPDRQLLRIVLAVIIIVAVGLASRVVYIQVIHRSHFLQVAKHLSSPKQPLYGQPGAIRDHQGRILADSVITTSVKADPKLIQQSADVEAVSEFLADQLDLPVEQIRKKINSGRDFVYLKRRVPLAVSDRIMAKSLAGISRDLEYKRVYPQGTVGCHLLGYYSSDYRPLAGLEYQYRFVIEGQAGTPRRNQDAWGRTIVGMENQPGLPPVPGKDLVLTVDWNLQEVVEDALEQCWDYQQPDQATAVVMAPSTGAILAMAARPNYDPNQIASAAAGIARVNIPKDHLINLTVSREYEPGSTFKVLLAAAALETGAVTLSDTFVCPGIIQLGGKPLRCWGRWANIGHGSLNLADTLARSCNINAAQIAVKIGAQRYWQFLHRCGIGQLAHVGLPGEADGRLQAPDDMYKRDVANIGFGQNVAVTDVQLIAGICAVVNGGRLMQPYLVDRLLNPDGTTYRQVEPVLVRHVCSEETSRALRAILRGVVEKPYGTGQSARIPGVAVGGKTGTAQIWDPQRREYRKNEHMLSFVLVAPVDTQPQFVILVTMRNPKKGRYASQVAAPVARQIAVHMLRERDLIPPEALPKLNSS